MLGVLHENGSGVGIYLDSKCGFKGEGMPFFCRKEVRLSSDLLDTALFRRKFTISSPGPYSIVKEHSSWKRGNIW
jgi:hypothetical protein